MFQVLHSLKVNLPGRDSVMERRFSALLARLISVFFTVFLFVSLPAFSQVSEHSLAQASFVKRISCNM